MSTLKALIIDDEPDIRELLSLTLLRMGIDSDNAKNVTEAKQRLDSSEYNLCLSDMRLPDGNGLDIVEYIQDHKPGLPVAVITAHGSMDLAVQAMKAGAFDFINKPVDLKSLRMLVEAATKSNTSYDAQAEPDIVGASAPIETLKAAIKKLARSQAAVYISGESGTGKELAARSIHGLGPRAKQPFIAVNCGAIPSELVESEFFGHKKGSFTGATHDNDGLFLAANGGTLFLDEVADLPLSMQVKILRAIQEKIIRPVGSQTEIPIDVRILSATHKDLSTLVHEGTFRQDLFYRLNVIQLDVPPLRERRQDIPELVDHILRRLDTTNTIKIEKTAMTVLENYYFPGNIRELENILERAFTLCEKDTITQNDLNLSATDVPQDTLNTSGKIDHFQKALSYTSIDEYLAEIEKEILLEALEHDRWNKTNAAQTLGITFRSFRYRLNKLGLDEES